MPDIAFVTSIIGGGKSLNGTRIVCDELENGDRLISTSLPLFLDDHWVTIKRTKGLRPPPGIPAWWESPYAIQDVDDGGRALKSDSMRMFVFGLATWCHNEIKKPVDLNQRLRLLKHDEISKFYLHLPNRDLPELLESLPGRKPVSVPDLTARNGDGGCVFIIDEIHNYFSARNYLEAGPGVERYQSQLRKLNDDMWMISQHLEKVDKNFRRNATLTYEMKNMSKQKLWGGVTLNERFNWAKYPAIPSRNDKPTETGHFMLRERGMCWLYDTMAGVGVTGGMKADQPKKGRHWMTWVFIALLICVAAYVLPRMAMRGFGYGMGHMMASVQKGVAKGLGQHPTVASRPALVAPMSVTVSRPSLSVVNPALNLDSGSSNVTCLGYCVLGRHLLAFLSDGRTLDSNDLQVQRVTPRMLFTLSGNFPILPGKAVSESHYDPLASQPLLSSPLPESSSQNSVSVTVIGQSYVQRSVKRSSQFANYRSTLPGSSQSSFQQNQNNLQNETSVIQGSYP